MSSYGMVGPFQRTIIVHLRTGIRARMLWTVTKRPLSAFSGLVSGERVIPAKLQRDKLWREFFSDPSQWWDNRSDKVWSPKLDSKLTSCSWTLWKVNPRCPDFTHKRTKEALWADGKLTPSWVQAELGAMAPGSVPFNIFSWNKSLVRCVKAGQYERAVDIFEQLQQEGINPDRFTFTPVINACAGLRAIELGRRVHSKIIQVGCESDIYVCNSLIDMYAKCGSIDDAARVFNQMPKRDAVSWSSMIKGHVKCGQEQKALELFQQMQQEKVEPTPATFLGVLNACASLGALDEGQRVHEEIIQRGFESNMFVGSCLVDMYAKCGSIEDALIVFNKMPTRNVVAWNALIMGHVKCRQGHKALELCGQMLEEGIIPAHITFVAMLNACASVMALKEGRLVHEQIIQRGWESDVFVCNSLIDMYAKCRSMEDAWRVFNKMPTRDVCGWSAIILGHVKCGEGEKALELFQQMQREGVEPDPVSFVVVLNACSSVAALEEGRHLHEQITHRGYERDVFVTSSLVDMYAKCGSMEDAIELFNRMPQRNTVSWTAMLGGFAIHGLSKEALLLFEQMCIEGVELDSITFISLLSACCHRGLVDEGLHYFKFMNSVQRMCPNVEHCGCMIDLLGRAGRLHEAEDLIKTMLFKPTATVWTAFLGACRVHGNVEMGECIAEKVVELDPGNAAGYVLLSDMYAANSRQDSSLNLQRQKLEDDLEGDSGCTWTEVNSQLHSFTTDDQQHPQISEIHMELGRLLRLIKDIGYVTETIHDVEKQDRVSNFRYHSERLAIAFGIMRTPPGTTVRMLKNLRVCSDCHTFIKFISKIAGRTILFKGCESISSIPGRFMFLCRLLVILWSR